MNLKTITRSLLKGLKPMQKEVVARRFGLERPEHETLEAIGQDHDLTRERVRQIQERALYSLRAQTRLTQAVFEHLKDYLQEWGGLRREDRLLAEAGRGRFSNEVYFFLQLGEDFKQQKEDDRFHPFWFIGEEAQDKLQVVLEALQNFLEGISSPVNFEQLQSQVKIRKLGLALKQLQAFLETSKIIRQGPLGHYGLSHWSEVNPRGVRDKSYIVLKYEQRPLHFREVAEKINGLFYERGLSQRPALSQTVHNELIKDDRFVLVGRGLYALKDWGYVEGTCKDIICKILKESGRPLPRGQIINKVKEQRLVQDSTITLNLSDKALFGRDKHGRYILLTG